MKNLKSKLFFLLACGLMAAGVVSCSKDEPSEGYYLNFQQGSYQLARVLPTATIDISTNIPNLAVDVPLGVASWCSATIEDGNKLVVTLATNESTEKRDALLTVSGRNVSKSITIEQMGREGAGNSISDDVLVRVASANATSAQPGEGIDKCIDGDIQTYYHSSWSNSSPTYFPITLDFNFVSGSSAIDYIVYYPRQDGGYNGHFKEIELWTSSYDNTTLVKVGDYDFVGSSSVSLITLDTPLANPRQVRIVVKSGGGDGQGFASCAEMQFYSRNTNNFDYRQYFADDAATTLKAGITMKEIEAIPYSFYKDLATEIFTQTYDSEFRIQEFKAWMQPEIMAGKNSTSFPYSLNDNPTGIYVKAGEELIVFANELQGQSLSLVVRDYMEGFGGIAYPITRGANRLKIQKGGLIYLLYHTQSGTGPNVKLHFATGSVNGYFDVAKHQADDWKRLLNKATYREFDLVGNHAHLTFPTASFRAYTPSGVELIGIYDRLVELETDFMGLNKYDRQVKNRMYFHVLYTPDDYMYATHYRTGYNQSTMSDICDVAKLGTSSIWGPAHEVGHMNQTTPGLKWTGMTEVTNNIMSLYVQTTFGNTSRLIAENTYNKAVSEIVNGRIAHNSSTDVFCQLVPFWQLYLYFVRAKGNADFYKDLYEAVRNAPTNLPNQGGYQLAFVEHCCDVAGVNMLEFFEQWGFLTPIDKVITDYVTERFTITQDEIDALKAKITAKSYPTPGRSDIYLITDNNWNSYR